MKSSSFLAAKIVVFPNDCARRPLKGLGWLGKNLPLLGARGYFFSASLAAIIGIRTGERTRNKNAYPRAGHV